MRRFLSAAGTKGTKGNTSLLLIKQRKEQTLGREKNKNATCTCQVKELDDRNKNLEKGEEQNNNKKQKKKLQTSSVSSSFKNKYHTETLTRVTRKLRAKVPEVTELKENS